MEGVNNKNKVRKGIDQKGEGAFEWIFFLKVQKEERTVTWQWSPGKHKA